MSDLAAVNAQAPRAGGDRRLQIQAVSDRRSLREFIRLPWQIYRDDPAWVPPLLFERRQQLAPANPYFKHAKMSSWVVCRGKRPVGRISAQIDRLHLDRYQDATGFFGMLEAEDDPAIFELLLKAAEDWLRSRGMRRVVGPFNLSINQECGLLVSGHDTPPYFMMPHNPAYYEGRIEALGYGRVKDTLAYLLDVDFELTRAMRAVIRRYQKRVRLRPLDLGRLHEDLEVLRDIQEDAWSHNWNFIPFTPEEFEHLGRDLKLLVPTDLVQIAEFDGSPAAMIVGFPNINEAIRDLNGRLLPLGWLKLLWRLKVGFPRTARCPLMGVRTRYHNSALGAALALMVVDRGREVGKKLGIEQMELSWILEDNQGMRSIIESIGGKVHKRYRFFAKELGPQP